MTLRSGARRMCNVCDVLNMVLNGWLLGCCMIVMWFVVLSTFGWWFPFVAWVFV